MNSFFPGDSEGGDTQSSVGAMINSTLHILTNLISANDFSGVLNLQTKHPLIVTSDELIVRCFTFEKFELWVYLRNLRLIDSDLGFIPLSMKEIGARELTPVQIQRLKDLENMVRYETPRPLGSIPKLLSDEEGSKGRCPIVNFQSLLPDPLQFPIPTVTRDLKILVFSDTHGDHEQILSRPSLYPCQDPIIFLGQVDVVIFAGDCCDNGDRVEMLMFLDWFSDLPVKHKIFVAGNHDYPLVIADWKLLSPDRAGKIHFLDNSYVLIKGVKFYGAPSIPLRKEMANNFNTIQRKNLSSCARSIHLNTDVLITHAPPFGIGDANTLITIPREGHEGNEGLMGILEHPDSKIKYHIFGHVHVGRGNYRSTKIPDTLFVNCSQTWQILTLTR